MFIICYKEGQFALLVYKASFGINDEVIAGIFKTAYTMCETQISSRSWFLKPHQKFVTNKYPLYLIFM